MTSVTGFTFRDNTSDKNIFYDVFERNEYKLPVLKPTDLVLDIGAHIGSFSAKAYAMGSRSVVAYEPDKANYDLAKKHLEPYSDGVIVVNAAVVGSDDVREVYHSGYTVFEHGEINTGGGNTVQVTPATVGATSVPAISIRTIFDTMGVNSYSRRLKVLKLDCEGAEWDILYSLSSTYKSSIDYICMEFHEYGTYTAGDLIAHLRMFGLQVDYFRHGTSNLGMIFAKSGAMI